MTLRLGSVDLELDPIEPVVRHCHKIVVSDATSDCTTCFDSTEVRTIPVATYTPSDMRKNRCASVAMISGPSLMKSGAMGTELVLTHGDGRVRVLFQHAPVWKAGVEPGSCPPQGLKLFRTVVSRETLRDGPPTVESETARPPPRGNPTFFRSVPPFAWHKSWAGSSWTWGPSSGNRGWEINEMEEADAWHSRPTGDIDGTWAMRIQGGILLQCPKVVVGGEVGLCRMAWLAEDDGIPGTSSDGDMARLLRVEAGIVALEPVMDNENNVMVAFHPPRLVSLRTDVMTKVGELENVSLLERSKNIETGIKESDESIPPSPDGISKLQSQISASSPNVRRVDNDKNKGKDDDENEALENLLKL